MATKKWGLDSIPMQCATISGITSDSAETLDGFVTCESLETLGGCSSRNQSPVSVNVESVGSLVYSVKNDGGEDDLVSRPVEILEYESIVSGSSNGAGSSPSSSTESDDCALLRLPNEKLHKELSSTMQVEPEGSPSHQLDMRCNEDSDGRSFHDAEDRPFDTRKNDERGSDDSQWCQSGVQWPLSNQENKGDGPPGFSFSMREIGHAAVGAGLFNLGNTCFVNAILQCFTHTVPLVKALRSCNHVMPCDRAEFCIICFLRGHIENSIASSGNTVSPSKLVANLNYISPSFHRYQQEDAHEFLQCLLDRLERCCLNMNGTWAGSSSQHVNIVQQVFGGRLVSKLHCCNCGYCSDKYEPLIDLSLEIEHVDSLQSALESFTKVEKIEDPESKFMCENCKEATSKEKQLKLDQVPSVAVMHLKRFKTDGLSIEKIGKRVEFPLELNMKPYTNYGEEDDVDLKYHLYGIVVHQGMSPTSGHYFCFIRSCPETWHELDDSMVTKFQEEHVLSQAAYILFYAKEGTPWFSNLMDSQKLCLDPCTSNTSPKSVLDSLDRECTCFSEANIDSSMGGSTAVATDKIYAETILAEAQNNGTMDEMAVAISQKTRDETRESGSQVDDPMLNMSIPHGKGDCHNAISEEDEFVAQSPGKENCNEGSHTSERNDGLDLTTPISLKRQNVKVGSPGPRYRIPLDHLKQENKVNLKRPPVQASEGTEIREATRYLRQMPNSRSMKLLAAMLPKNDKKRKLGSSPCKRASPSSRNRSTHSVTVLR
ncbi:hypothetical protein K2173_002899 [Erythroxylum novogranatense]|uniref:Ubiquitin carboxyl-terminal hydrolase n=1 Tax=Erythroxylum novogranatense TaxID=1862640 RepID=A0AAV8SQW6_9ROSI|nr:hypothetical protein K2173_002899 [Erythroxylum novogranatense]